MAHLSAFTHANIATEHKFITALQLYRKASTFKYHWTLDLFLCALDNNKENLIDKFKYLEPLAS